MMKEFYLQKKVIKLPSMKLFQSLQISFQQSMFFFRCFHQFKTFICDLLNTQKIKYNSQKMQSLHLSEEESPQRAEKHSSSHPLPHNSEEVIHQGHLLNSKHSHFKNKQIKKTKSKGSKASKERSQEGEDSSDRSKDNIKMGRPNKDLIDKKHTQLSKKFNDIIYCSSRFLIFFYLIKGKDEKIHALTLTPDQSNWMCQANHLMRLNNFPSIDNRSLPFLLHPNSLHFILHYNKVNTNERLYHPQRIKYYLFAWLIRKNLLTRTIWMYVSQYWTDIVQLINNWQKAARARSIVGRQDNYVEYQNEEDYDKGTVESMREEFEKDHSIAAHEIAGYLWACCQHFEIQIRSN